MLIYLACVQASVPRTRTALKGEFDAWVNKHNKNYGRYEYEIRFKNYLANTKTVDALNARAKSVNSTATYALNKFADLSTEERAARLGLKRVSLKNPHLRPHIAPAFAKGPASFDWRTHDKITPVKDQGQCGSCWAFSATESIESVYMIAKGLTGKNMPPLAPQQIVDCDHNGADGCNGGDLPTAFNYVKNAGGLERNADYPYHARDQTCHFEKAKEFVKISGFKYVIPDGSKDETAMANFLAANSPISIIVDAESWSFYSGGIVKASECGLNLDHAVQAVGYNTAGGYWIVRNSWGSDWGEQGFIRLQFGKNTCGLTSEVTVPTV